MIAVLDRLDVDRAVLAGHSDGRLVAARAAVEAPAGGRVVLVDGGLP